MLSAAIQFLLQYIKVHSKKSGVAEIHYKEI